MTIKLFGTNIAAEIGKATKGQLRVVTLTKRTAGTRTPGQLTGGTNPTTTAYTCDGVVEEYTDQERSDAAIAEGAKKVLIIAASLPSGVKPATPDTVAVGGDTFEVLKVTTDPAEAAWVCQSVGISAGVG